MILFIFTTRTSPSPDFGLDLSGSIVFIYSQVRILCRVGNIGGTGFQFVFDFLLFRHNKIYHRTIRQRKKTKAKALKGRQVSSRCGSQARQGGYVLVFMGSFSGTYRRPCGIFTILCDGSTASRTQGSWDSLALLLLPFL